MTPTAVLPRCVAPQVADEAARVRLATNPATPPDLLQALADDASVTVRAAVALNAGATTGIDAVLAQDTDERVRSLLARKLAHFLPMLARPEGQPLRDQVLATLATLVEDEAERVRTAIADVVKDMPEAPRRLILRLAQDSAVPVSEPVIRLSPLLTAADLLALVADPPAPHTITAVARRPDLTEAVADAIAATADNDAVAALLANPQAAIREATLDALVARAADCPAWHEPLVRRPALSARAARALSDIVATHLLAVLAGRADLDATLTAALRERLAQRLAQGVAGRVAEPAAVPAPVAADVELDGLLALAHRLRERGELTEAALLSATARDDVRRCTAFLAVAAGVAVGAVQRAATLRSAKALVSLAWQASFTMHVAVPLQSVVGRVPPSAVLRPTALGDFPLTAEEMRWQVDLLRRMGR